MTYYRPPTATERLADEIARQRLRLARELTTANPHLSRNEINERVALLLQEQPAPKPPGIPREVLDARRKERRATVAKGKSARLGDKRPGRAKLAAHKRTK